MKRVEIKTKDSIKEIRIAMRKTKDGRYRFRLAVIEVIISNPKLEYSNLVERFFGELRKVSATPQFNHI